MLKGINRALKPLRVHGVNLKRAIYKRFNDPLKHESGNYRAYSIKDYDISEVVLPNGIIKRVARAKNLQVAQTPNKEQQVSIPLSAYSERITLKDYIKGHETVFNYAR